MATYIPKWTQVTPEKNSSRGGCSTGNRGDGQFFDLSPQAGSGIAAAHSSRGLAIGDLDNDGNDEILILNMGEAPTLLKNVAPQAGHSILIRALTSTNRDAIGARITVTAGGKSRSTKYAAAVPISRKATSDCTSALAKRLRPTYPSGGSTARQRISPDVAAGQVVTIQEGKGIVKKQPFMSAKP